MKKTIITMLAILASVSANADESSHRQAAIDMMEASGIDKNLKAATQTQALTYMNQCASPETSAVTFIKFFEENESAIREGSIRNYMNVFTESELNEIAEANRTGKADFFESATGKKVQENTQLLDMEAYQLSKTVVESRKQEFDKLLSECK